MDILTRRFVLTGLIAAPAIISYDGLMAIKSYENLIGVRYFFDDGNSYCFDLDLNDPEGKCIYNNLSNYQPNSFGPRPMKSIPRFLDFYSQDFFQDYFLMDMMENG